MRTRRAVVALLFSIVVLIAPATPAYPGTICSWSILPQPPLVSGIAAISHDEAWVVGGKGVGPDPHPAVARFNGTGWSVTDIPDPGWDAGVLYAVDALSSNDIWAIGDHRIDDPQLFAPMAAHWNGATWTLFPVPSPAGRSAGLTQIDARTANDVWAVGWLEETDRTTIRGIVEHWNGVRWSRIPSPPQIAGLQDVAEISRHEVWVLGHNSIMHWDGSTWTLTSTPQEALYGISARSSNDIWAAGVGQGAGTVTTHWDGSYWSEVPTPDPRPGQGLGTLKDVASRTPTSAWAVGTHGSFSYPLVLHWNGTRWRRSETPADAMQYNELSGVDVVDGSRTVWAIGNNRNTGVGLVERYC